MSSFDQVYSDILQHLSPRMRRSVTQTELRELVGYVQRIHLSADQAKSDALALRSACDAAVAERDQKVKLLAGQVADLHDWKENTLEELIAVGRQLRREDLETCTERGVHVRLPREFCERLYLLGREAKVSEGEERLGDDEPKKRYKHIARVIEQTTSRYIGAQALPRTAREIEVAVRSALRNASNLPLENLTVVVGGNKDYGGSFSLQLHTDLEDDEEEAFMGWLDKAIANRR